MTDEISRPPERVDRFGDDVCEEEDRFITLLISVVVVVCLEIVDVDVKERERLGIIDPSGEFPFALADLFQFV